MTTRFEEDTLPLIVLSTLVPAVLLGMVAVPVVDISTMPGPCLGGDAVGEIAVSVGEVATAPEIPAEETKAGVAAGVAIVGDADACLNRVSRT